MGISWHEAKALIEIYKQNGPLGRTATLGRQALHLELGALRRLLAEEGLAPRRYPDAALTRTLDFAEWFFRILGATEVVSFDYADFEGATVCHDMNLPIPEIYSNAFDVVYDGGTLEHVFNFPQAIRNCMRMPRISGLFISSTPANNWMGHGFYQFSPELFFRVLSEPNGYRVERMIAAEYWEGGDWFEVQDPKQLGRRVELWGGGQRIQLVIVGRKLGPLSSHWTVMPQQSDYVSAWNTVAIDQVGGVQPSKERTRLFAFLSQRWPWMLGRYRGLNTGVQSQFLALVNRVAPKTTRRIRRFLASRRFQREIRQRNLHRNEEAFTRVNR